MNEPSNNTDESPRDTEPKGWCTSGCCRGPPFGGNREAVAWALDSCATSIAFVGAGAFLAPALIKLAKDAAGCETEKQPGETKVQDCNETIHGFKPSSLITFYATVIGLSAAVVMPLAGAIVDYTAYRRALGRILSCIFWMALFPTIFVSEDNWFAISIMFGVAGFVGWFETMVLYAYLPELTDDEEVLNRFTRMFSVLAFSGMVAYLAVIVGVAAGLGYSNDTDTLDDEIGTARLGMSVAVGINAVSLSIAWGWYFKQRPSAHELQEGQSVWTAGFQQIYNTIVTVRRRFPALKWFYVAIMFCEAAIQALLVFAITLLSDQLEFSGAEIGATILAFLVASIPGGIISSCFTGGFNPICSSMAAVIVLTINTAFVAAILKEPGQQVAAFIFAVGWGIGNGWKWTADRMLYGSILPRGQNAELSGGYVFFRQILVWLPPLISTIMNENDVNMRWSMAMLCGFFILGLYCYFRIGSYNAAVAEAQSDSIDAQGEENDI